MNSNKEDRVTCPICGKSIHLKDVRRVFSHEVNECVPLNGFSSRHPGNKIPLSKKEGVNVVWITKI